MVEAPGTAPGSGLLIAQSFIAIVRANPDICNIRDLDGILKVHTSVPVILGLIGSFAVVAAYFANQTGRLSSSDWRFPAANLVGALAILVSLADAWNLPSAVIEFFWAAISLYGLVRCLRQQSLRTDS